MFHQAQPSFSVETGRSKLDSGGLNERLSSRRERVAGSVN